MNHGLCPKCRTPLEADEVDVGVGTVSGPVGCPACHWVPEPDALAVSLHHEPVEFDERGTAPPLKITGVSIVPAAVASGPSYADQRTPAEHVEGFMRSATTLAQRAVADEIRLLRLRVLTLEGSITASAAIDRDERKAAERELTIQTLRADKLEAQLADTLARYGALSFAPSVERDHEKARAEKAEKERDAACAEMRAALEALLPIAFPVEGGSDGCGTVGGWKADALNQVRTALARTDLGRGMVAVKRDVVER